MKQKMAFALSQALCTSQRINKSLTGTAVWSELALPPRNSVIFSELKNEK